MACFRLTFFLALCWAALSTASRADFPIGSAGVPAVVVHASPEQFQVYANHPRLFFRDTDLPTIRKRIAGDYRELWQSMADYLTRLLKQDPAKYARNPYLKGWSYGRNMAFAAVVTGDERYRDWALRWADTMAAADPKQDTTDDDYRGRLMSLAVAYDWFFPQLSDVRKKSYSQALVAHIERNWSFAASPNFISGHSRWGNFALAAGLLAVSTEKPQLREKLLRVRHNWLFGYCPAQGWIAADGGYHMAWTYSAPYTDARIHCVWSSATNENIYYPWRAQLPYLFLYGGLGDGTYPNSGDAYSREGGLREGADTLAMAAGVFKNRHAAAMLTPTWDCFFELLYGDCRVKPLAPDDPDAPLPLARHFQPAGLVVMRDRWDERTTHLAFKSSAFYSANHHHRDENAFTLSYRGPLATDSGYYDAYGTAHWRNYYTRTIAHNAITVFDPAQEYRIDNKPVANDGGQVYRPEPSGLADIRPGGHAALDGILRYEHSAAFTYALGDATKAYDAERVRRIEREVVYLRTTGRTHPLVVVFDRVESTEPQYEKAFLLHAVNRPAVDGKRCVIENGGGRLTCLTLLPEHAHFELVGGPANEFSVGGVNYPPARLPEPWKAVVGAWRLEVKPVERRKQDFFLHVLLVDDADAPAVTPQSASCIQGQRCVGVEVAGWAVVFALDRNPGASLAYTFGAKSSRHLIVGGPLRGHAQWGTAQQSSKDCATGEGGCALFDTPRGAAATMHVRFRP